MLSNLRLKMLNREAASPQNKPNKIIKNLNIHKGNVIADIGSGGGYFTLEFGRKTGDNGIVYSVDTKQKSLDFTKKEAHKEGLKNIKTVLADDKGFSIPDQSVDLFFLRNVFHHLEVPVEYFQNLKRFLKPDGRVAIVDYKERSMSFIGIFGHFTPEKVLINTMVKSGFKPVEKFDFLQKQSFIIFMKII